MKKKVILYLFIFSAFAGCQKPFLPDDNCTNVKVTLTATSCKHVGVIINGTLYPTDDLPDQYAVEGINICIKYSFWEDQTKCICCGGEKVHIISIQ